MKIDYVLVGSNNNELYLDFWPIVSKVWFKKFNITPVLGIICDEDSDFIKSEFGLIKKFKKPSEHNDVLCSQIVRLYLPKFLNGNILISDLDMIPLSKKYFIDDISKYDNDKFIIFSSHNEQTSEKNQYPMCYVAGSSSVFSEIFDYNLEFDKFMDSVPKRGWETDQIFLFEQTQKLDRNRLEFPIREWGNNSKRIDRSYWVYDENLVKIDYYIDSHLLRPYKDNQNSINKLVNLLLND